MNLFPVYFLHFYVQVISSNIFFDLHIVKKPFSIFLFQVYKGYVDDPRNTDNAWMETVAVNFHDEKGLSFF